MNAVTGVNQAPEAQAPTTAARRHGIRPRTIAILLVAAFVGVVGGAGASWALWSDAVTNPSMQLATGSKVGISLERVDGTPQYATSASSVLTQTLGLAEAQAASGLNVAIPLAVRMRADGNAGISYSIARPTFRAGTLFAVSTVTLFPLSATTDAEARSQCNIFAAPGTQPATTGIVGIAPGVDPTAPQGVAVDYWCLTSYYFAGGGFYQNTGTANGTSPTGEQVTAQADWMSMLVDPGTYSLTHQITLPGVP